MASSHNLIFYPIVSCGQLLSLAGMSYNLIVELYTLVLWTFENSLKTGDLLTSYTYGKFIISANPRYRCMWAKEQILFSKQESSSLIDILFIQDVTKLVMWVEAQILSCGGK